MLNLMEKAQVNIIVIAVILIALISFAYIQFSPTGFALRDIFSRDAGGAGDTAVTTTIIPCIDNDKDSFGT